MAEQHDPHQWLESLTDPAVQRWVEQHNQQTKQQLDTDPRFIPMRDDILAHLRDTRQIPFFSEHQGWLYNFHQDAEHPRGVYRRTRLEDYQQQNQRWLPVLDLDALADDEGEDWFLDGVSHYTLQPGLALIHLSRGGGDASVVREYDLEQQQWLEHGFCFPEGKNHVAWRDQNSLFVCPGWDKAPLTKAGYPREVWLLERNDDTTPPQWTKLFDAGPQAMMVAAWRFLNLQGTPVDVIEASDSFYSKSYYLLDEQLNPQLLPLPPRCEMEAFIRGDLIIKLSEDWQINGQSYPAGALLAIRLESLLTQQVVIQLLLVPTGRAAIEAVETTHNTLVVNLLDNVRSRLLVFEHNEGQWQARPLPVPDSGVIEFVDQPWYSDTLYYSFSDFLTPTGLYRLDVVSGELTCLRQQPAAFDASPYIAEQKEALSADGERIPYFIVHRRDNVLDGTTPTLLYGYGGFEVPMLPYYVENFGPHWLDKGGAFVLACIRGGGEFGPAWHQAAQGRNRSVSFDDFIAVAEHLVASGITSPRRLGIEGGSNGGLLVGACMVRRPELFNAVVCEVPLLDMLRYTQLLAGASWVDEYGDPDDPEDAAALAAYSPYHHLDSNARYPYALFTTSAKDDRVHPAHARKMVAKLEEQGHPVMLLETSVGGHTGNAGQEQTAEELTRVIIYLYQQLMD